MDRPTTVQLFERQDETGLTRLIHSCLSFLFGIEGQQSNFCQKKNNNEVEDGCKGHKYQRQPQTCAINIRFPTSRLMSI